MPKSTKVIASKQQEKMLHIRIPVDLLKRLRHRVVEQETSLQRYVARLIENDLSAKK
ncbi:MAG: hypothetical protein IPG71_10660 [bacterium]|nr:hypothetical protein [bacterium]